MTVGSFSANSMERPQDRANVVLYYAATSPTQVFNQAASQVAEEEGWHSLSENARALALINMALSDGVVPSFLNKYHYNFWRPETAIHAGDTDDNPKTEGDPELGSIHPDSMFSELSLKSRYVAVTRQPRCSDVFTAKLHIRLRCQIRRCRPSSCNTPRSGKLPKTSPTHVFTVGYIFEPIRPQARAWETR